MRHCFVALTLLIAACPSEAPSTRTVTCAADQTVCGDSCANLETDPAHCGSCERPCGNGESCASGECVATACAAGPCAAGLVCVAEKCVDKTCVGVTCTTDRACVAGKCECTATLKACGDACAEIETDAAHCGGCGRPCGAGETCVGGKCFPADCSTKCGPGEVCFNGECTDRACLGKTCGAGEECRGGACVSCGPLDTDANCGACGTSCDTGETCVGARCLPKSCPNASCAPGSACIDGECVEASCAGVSCKTDERCVGGDCLPCPLGSDTDCVACGDACAAGTTCVKDRCLPLDCDGTRCAPGSVCIEGSCVESACAGVRCGQDERCVAGSCVACPIGTDSDCVACGDACATGSTCVKDRCLPRDCPGAPCGPGAVCFSGRCVSTACAGVTCDTSQTCDATGTCVSCGSLTTEANCGACGNACEAGHRCVSGSCLPRSCGTTTCGAEQVCAGGTCIDIACLGKSCATNERCSAGACVCTSGTERCPADTACRSLSSDDANCGACNRACGNGERCSGGVCGCGTGFVRCDGACVDVKTDPAHCNACGRACGTGLACVAGSCACAAGLLSCGGGCIDQATSNLHCGGCNRPCVAGKTCSGGACVDPITCGSTFDVAALAGCSLFPARATGCGNESPVSTTSFTATSVSGGAVSKVITVRAQDIVRVTGTARSAGTSDANHELYLATPLGVQRGRVFATVGAPEMVITSATGSPLECNRPATVVAGSTFRSATHDVEIQVSERVGANVGGQTLAEAVPLRKLSGTERTCDQHCGQILRTPCEEFRYWKATIPPFKSLDIEWMGMATSNGGAQFKIEVYDQDRIRLCRVANAALYDQGERGTYRVTNNLPTPRTVYIEAFSDLGNVTDYDIAFGTEQ